MKSYVQGSKCGRTRTECKHWMRTALLELESKEAQLHVRGMLAEHVQDEAGGSPRRYYGRGMDGRPNEGVKHCQGGRGGEGTLSYLNYA